MGDISLIVNDTNSAAVFVPSSSTIYVMGTCSAGTVGQIIVSQNPNTFLSNCGYGPGVELAALIASLGGMVLFTKLPVSTHGALTGASQASSTISTATDATPIVVTTSAAHDLTTGDIVTIAGVTTNTAANGTFVVTVTGAETFTLNGSTGIGAGTGGTAQFTGAVFVGTGTSVITTTLDSTNGCFDNYFVVGKCTAGGTVGTGPISFQLSLDAGRTFGPTLALGAATTYQIPNTGITLNFAAGTLETGDVVQLGTTAPAWSTGGVEAALTLFAGSQYALQGVGNMILDGAVSNTTAATIETGGMDVLAAGNIYNRLMVNAADATIPVAYGGQGQTESAWISALASAYSSNNTKRLCVSAGFYNTPSVFTNPAAGQPLYRRPLSWDLACRQVKIPIQQHAGRVKTGPLSTIVVNPTTDPTDGFVYHDERQNAGLTPARFCVAKTRIKTTGGFYIDQPALMAPAGSTVTLLPLGDVLDEACDIVYQVGQIEIDDDIQLNTNGTIDEGAARDLENAFDNALQTQMIAAKAISNESTSVDRTTDVEETSQVVVNVSIQSRGYILSEAITIGFNN